MRTLFAIVAACCLSCGDDNGPTPDVGGEDSAVTMEASVDMGADAALPDMAAEDTALVEDAPTAD